MSSVLIIFFIFGFIISAASLINHWEGTTKMFRPMNSKKLCKVHTWGSIALVGPEHLEGLKNDPSIVEDYSTHLCTTCGYVPSKEAMLHPEVLKATVLKLQQIREFEQRTKDIEELKAEFLQAFFQVSSYSEEERKFIAKGYEHYDRFVNVLPSLVQMKQARRAEQQGVTHGHD